MLCAQHIREELFCATVVGAFPGAQGTCHWACCESIRMRRAQVFGVTRDPFIIWTSNMFAIASLRALYGLVANVLAELRFLEKAIAIVLAWIGTKMIIEARARGSPAVRQLLQELAHIGRPQSHDWAGSGGGSSHLHHGQSDVCFVQ